MYSFIVLMSLSAHLVDLSLQVVDHLRRHLVTQDLVQVDALVSRDGLVGGQLYAFLYLQVERGRLEYVCGEVRDYTHSRTFCISASLGMRKVFCACLMASRVKAAPSRWGPGAAAATASTAAHAKTSTAVRMITPGRTRALLYSSCPSPGPRPPAPARHTSHTFTTGRLWRGPLVAPLTAPRAPPPLSCGRSTIRMHRSL